MIYWFGVLSVLIAIECVFLGTALSIFFPAKPAIFNISTSDV